MRRPVAALICVTFAALAAAPSFAQTAQPPFGHEFERPIGWAYGEEDQPISGSTRDRNGNRVIVDGRIVLGDDLTTLPPGLWNMNGMLSGGDGFSGTGRFVGTNTAIGNQLNVITQGSNNTFIVNSTQINNGNQIAVLNGELDLND